MSDSRFKTGDKVVVVKPMPRDYHFSDSFTVGSVWTVARPSDYDAGIYIADSASSSWYPDEYFGSVDERVTVGTLQQQVDSLRRQGYTVVVKVTPPPVLQEEIVL